MIDLAGIPLAGWSMRVFAAMTEIEDVVIATEPEFVASMGELASHIFGNKPVRVIPGGSTRQESVRNALAAFPERCTEILIHDGARPLVRAHDVRAGMSQVRPGRGAVLAIPVIDTVKVVDTAAMVVVETLPRERLWAAQTPQFGTRADLERAHDQAARIGVVATDDAALLERIGVIVAVVPTTGENFKVTMEEDLARAESLLRERQ